MGGWGGGGGVCVPMCAFACLCAGSSSWVADSGSHPNLSRPKPYSLSYDTPPQAN